MKYLKTFALLLMVLVVFTVPALAASTTNNTASATDNAVADEESISISGKAIGCGIAIGIAAAGGAVGMGIAAGRSTESIARQPEATGEIRSTLMLSLVFIETAIIYALLVTILLIFVL